MERETRTAMLMLVCSIVMVASQSGVTQAGEPPQKSERPKLYDTNADGNEQIAATLKTARAEDKRVLLKFGANR